MTVTGARQTKRGRIAVEIDGEYLASVSPQAWIDSGLYEGCETEPEQLNRLLRENRTWEAKQRALRMLSAQSYTTWQLTRRLAAKTDQESAEQAVQRMEELGLLDDADYAKRFAQELFENRRFAPRRIRLELTRRGIPSSLCEEAIDALDLDSLEERAAQLVAARFGIPQTPAEQRRAAALLERYGYPAAIVRSVLHGTPCGEYSETEDML